MERLMRDDRAMNRPRNGWPTAEALSKNQGIEIARALTSLGAVEEDFVDQIYTD